jgi:hypothetical protein
LRRALKTWTGSGNVLELLGAEFLDLDVGRRELGTRHGGGEPYFARRRQRLQPGGDVDRRAMAFPADQMHLAELQADLPVAAAGGSSRSVMRQKACLRLQRGGQQAVGIVEDRQHEVARHLQDRSVVGRDRLEQHAAAVAQHRNGVLRILEHQLAIADKVGRQHADDLTPVVLGARLIRGGGRR